jgi:hypothetical protein
LIAFTKPSGSTGEQLREQGLVSRQLAAGSLAARTAGLQALIETPEAMEAYVLRAQGQDDAKRRARRCIEAVQQAPYPAVPATTPEQTKDGA